MRPTNVNLVANGLERTLMLLKRIGRKGRAAIALVLSSVALSLLFSSALETLAQPAEVYGMVDPVAENYQVGYEIYVERCATCHVALPPAVLPLEAWATITSDSAHYGVSLPAIPPFDQQLMVNYLQAYSRSSRRRGATAYRLSDSDFFVALHPDVALPEPLNLRSCAGCHAGAVEQDYSGATAQAQ